MANYAYFRPFGVLLVGGSLLYPASQLGAAVTATRLIGELDSYTPPGGSANTIEGLSDISTNSIGSFVIRPRTFPPFNNTGFAHLFGSPDLATPNAVLYEENTTAIAGYFREGFGSKSFFNNVGQLAYGADIATTNGGATIDSIWIDNTPVILEGDSISGLPGENFGNTNLVGFDDSGTLYYKGSYGADSTGFFSGTGTPIFKTGDPIGGYGGTILDDTLGGVGNVFMSPDGSNYMTEVDVNPEVWSPATPFPITDLMLLNGNALSWASDPAAYLLEDTPIPAADGGLGDNWNGSFSRYAVNNAGKWGTTGDTDAAVNDAIIVVDGKIIAREGDILPTESGGTAALAGSANNIIINEQGDVAFSFGDALVINGVVYMTVGNAVDTGETISKVQGSLAMTDRDVNDMVTVFFVGRDTSDISNSGDTAYSFQITLDPLTIQGDLDGDGFVGINDLNIVLGNWNQNVPPANPLADPSGDGFVGIDDLNAVLGNWNAGTPPDAVASIPEPGTAGVLLMTGVLCRRRYR